MTKIQITIPILSQAQEKPPKPFSEDDLGGCVYLGQVIKYYCHFENGDNEVNHLQSCQNSGWVAACFDCSIAEFFLSTWVAKAAAL